MQREAKNESNRSKVESRKIDSESPAESHPNLGGRFGYFFFSARGRGKGSPRRREGGGDGFLWKIPGGGGGLPRRWEGVCGEFFWGAGGLNILFSGPKFPPSNNY